MLLKTEEKYNVVVILKTSRKAEDSVTKCAAVQTGDGLTSDAGVERRFIPKDWFGKKPSWPLRESGE